MERTPPFSSFMYDRRAIIHGSNDSCMTGVFFSPMVFKRCFSNST
jgi:hypothetical protein